MQSVVRKDLKKGNAKLALMAVCNKLLRQAFGIIKSKQEYQPDFAK
jgi:peptidyl-tRNA hydrolase